MPDQQKHIVLYTDDPEYGGVAHYNHSVLIALLAQGHRVTCIQPRSESPLVKAQQAAGIQHEWIGYDAQKDFTRSITDLVDAERLFSKVDPDFIIFSDCCPVSNIAARHIAVTRGIPYIVVVNFVAKYLAEKFKGCLGVLAKQHAYAQSVVAVSQENLDLLRNHFGTPAEKGIVIHYGRPAKYFAPHTAETRARLRVEMNIPPDAVVCFSAARLTAIKGFQHILSAAAALKNTPAWAHLYFVWAGDGELRDELQKHIDALGMGDRFRLLGQRWDVSDLHEAADMFALPSHFEGMPLTIMEAMARRVPVVASAVSGIPEELGDTGCLIVNPEVNVEAAVKGLADAIARWASDPVARRAAAEKCHARAQEFFREELMLARVTKLVGDALLRAPAKKPVLATPAAKPTLRGLLEKQLERVPVLTAQAVNAQVSAVEKLASLLNQIAPASVPTAKEYHVVSPVCMIVFNRPNHTAKVFEAIRRARPAKLFLIADGARAEKPADPALCAEVKKIVGQVDWPCDVKTNFAPANLGCTKRVVSGLDWVFENVERCIILEDDCVPSPDFFRFCDEMLEKYRDDEQVRCVSGNSFQFGLPRGDASYFFTHHSLIWGWATWRRAWKRYDLRMREWPSLRATRFLFARFGDPKAANYWARYFDAAYAGRTAWDYPWVFSCWAGDGVGICPAVDLIENVGFDHQATGNIAAIHPIFINLFAKLPVGRLPETLKHPSDKKVNAAAVACTQRYHYEQDWPLLRRELATLFLGMTDAEFADYLRRNSAAVPLNLLKSGLAEMPVQDVDRPLVRRCEESLKKTPARLQDLVAAGLFVPRA